MQNAVDGNVRSDDAYRSPGFCPTSPCDEITSHSPDLTGSIAGHSICNPPGSFGCAIQS